MDFAAVGSFLLDKLDRPALVLDPSHRIVAYNLALAGRFGWSHPQAIGRHWREVALDGPDRAEGGDQLEALANQRVSRVEVRVDVPSGKLVLDLEGSPLPEQRGLLLMVTRSRAHTTAPPPFPAGVADLHFEIAVTDGRMGPITKYLNRDNSPQPDVSSGEPCYRFLGRREGPCVGCPLVPVPLPGDHSPRVGILASATHAHQMRIVLGRRVSADRVRVSVLNLSEDVLSSLVEGRAMQLAKAARLSEREREVYRLLLLGRSAKEIGAVLGITPRTVKYHQANTLDKLGADSRLDLIRLLF